MKLVGVGCVRHESRRSCADLPRPYSGKVGMGPAALERSRWSGHTVTRQKGGCSGQAAAEIPGVRGLAWVQRQESCKQLKVPGLCSCLFGTGCGPTCSVDGRSPLPGAGRHERSRGVRAPRPSQAGLQGAALPTPLSLFVIS